MARFGERKENGGKRKKEKWKKPALVDISRQKASSISAGGWREMDRSEPRRMGSR